MSIELATRTRASHLLRLGRATKTLAGSIATMALPGSGRGNARIGTLIPTSIDLVMDTATSLLTRVVRSLPSIERAGITLIPLLTSILIVPPMKMKHTILTMMKTVAIPNHKEVDNIPVTPRVAEDRLATTKTQLATNPPPLKMHHDQALDTLVVETPHMMTIPAGPNIRDMTEDLAKMIMDPSDPKQTRIEQKAPVEAAQLAAVGVATRAIVNTPGMSRSLRVAEATNPTIDIAKINDTRARLHHQSLVHHYQTIIEHSASLPERRLRRSRKPRVQCESRLILTRLNALGCQRRS